MINAHDPEREASSPSTEEADPVIVTSGFIPTPHKPNLQTIT